MLWSLLFLAVVGLLLPLSSWQGYRYLLGKTEQHVDGPPSSLSLALQAMAAHVVIAGMGLAAASQRDLPIRWPSSLDLASILAAVGVLAVLVGAASLEARRPLGEGDQLRAELRRTALSGPWLVAMVVAAFAEELAYRGVLFQLLSEAMPPLAAALLAAALFGLAHFSQGPRGAALGVVFALAMQGLVALSGGLLLATFTHLVYDSTVAWLGARLAQRTKPNRN